MGTATVNPDGSILYTPFNDDRDGDIDQITYELCNQFVSCGSNTINITINNSAPVINIAPTLIQPGGRASVSLLSGITDLNGNIDPSSIGIKEDPSSGLVATIDSDLNLIIDYGGTGFTGADHILIEACDFSGACTEFDVVIVVGEVNAVTVYQGVTPNNDGINDVLRILDVEFFPNNEMFIYNKIGKLVYNVTGYNNFGVVFAGFDDQGNELPDGTYYYVIILNEDHRQSGFVVLQR
jgi:gliding motility-associated-like protein